MVGQENVDMEQFIKNENKKHFENAQESPYYRYQQKLTEENFEMIDVGKIKYAKKIAIIYNPEAGKKKSIKDKISKRLQENGIQFEFIETKAYMDAVNIVKNLPIDDYSAIVSVGGDGTSHEVINGLFYRKDKKKLPLAFLPNGTGNDFCQNLSLENVDKGLDYIVKGDLIKTDIFRVLLDYESEEELYIKKYEDPTIDILQ